MTSHAHKSGGWGAGNDDQHCPECNKEVCGANLDPERIAARKASRPTATKCAHPICHNSPGARTDHPGFGKCTFHMGRTPSVKQAAARQEVRTMMRMYGAPVPIDAEEALREEIHRTVGHVRWLSDKIAALGERVVIDGPVDQPRAAGLLGAGKRGGRGGATADPTSTESEPELNSDDIERVIATQPSGDDALVWGVKDREVQSGTKESYDRVHVGASMNIWLQVYMAERGHLAKITEIAMKAGLESRRIDWAEGMADRLLTAFEDLALELGADPKDAGTRVAITGTLERIVMAS